MSYALALSDKARDSLRQLPVWLQEETLDELDRLADGGVPLPPRRDNSRLVVHDLVRERIAEKHYVFLTLESGGPTNVLTVWAIGHTFRTGATS